MYDPILLSLVQLEKRFMFLTTILIMLLNCWRLFDKIKGWSSGLGKRGPATRKELTRNNAPGASSPSSQKGMLTVHYFGLVLSSLRVWSGYTCSLSLHVAVHSRWSLCFVRLLSRLGPASFPCPGWMSGTSSVKSCTGQAYHSGTIVQPVICCSSVQFTVMDLLVHCI